MNKHLQSQDLDWLRTFCSGEVDSVQILQELSRRHRAGISIPIFLGLTSSELNEVAKFVSKDDIDGAIGVTEATLLRRVGSLEDLDSHLVKKARKAYWLLLLTKLLSWLIVLLVSTAVYAGIVYRYIDRKYFWYPNKADGWEEELSKFWLVSDFLRALIRFLNS